MLLFFALFYCLLDLRRVECDVVSLYVIVSLLMNLFVVCVACLIVFVNCLVEQFAICLDVFAISLLNVIDLLSVVGGGLLDRPCMVFQRMCVLCL